MNSYPVSKELSAAIDRLFGAKAQPAMISLGAVAIDLELAAEHPRSAEPLPSRAKALREKLEGYIRLKADEAEEYDDPRETARLQAEARGMLIALREIAAHLPESR